MNPDILSIELPIITPAPSATERRPDWLKVRVPTGETFGMLKQMMRSKQLHTVCEEARCPNMAECWAAGTATFMILGDTCTRSCGFCAVKTGRPEAIDLEEPQRVADAVRRGPTARTYFFRGGGVVPAGASPFMFYRQTITMSDHYRRHRSLWAPGTGGRLHHQPAP